MSKTDELNKLFEKWIKDFPVYKGKFIRDGGLRKSNIHFLIEFANGLMV